MSTTTSFARIRWWRGEDGVVLVFVVVGSSLGGPMTYLWILLLLGFFVLQLMITNGSVEFSQKKISM
jgi:hypothetical protein